MPKPKHLEVILWSIAFPGFGQFLNQRFFKGVTFLILEFVINTRSGLNTIILSSFHGEIERAIKQTNYQWLMFYPCVYLFAIWDASRDAGGEKGSYSVFPSVFSAYFGTIGVIYSPSFKIAGILLGPIWLPILFMLLGSVIGFLFKILLSKISKSHA
jgi:hypothetical protein